MKNLLIFVIIFSSFLLSQDPVGKLVAINELNDIFTVNENHSSVYLLKNGSYTWTDIGGDGITGIYGSPDNSIFVETNFGLYHSTNTSNYTLNQILVETKIFSVVVNSFGTIFSGTSDGLYKSVDNGLTWSITYEYPLKMAVSSTDVMYIDEYNKGLCRTTDLGVNWEDINYNIPNDRVISDIQIAADGTVFILVENNGIYKLSGNEWITQGFNYTNVNSLHAGKDGNMYCSLGDKIYKKTVAQSFWSEIKSDHGRITSFSSNSRILIAKYADFTYIFKTLDWGNTWTILASP